MSSNTITGIWDAVKLPGIALAATMLGFATMAREAGLSLAMTLASTGGIWGLPGQVAMVGLWAGGSSLLLIFIAVSMANMRMLLMMISASDMMNIKQLNLPLWKHLLYFHMMAVTGWIQVGYMAPHHSPQSLLQYYRGFACTIFIMALLGTMAGYFVADLIPSEILRIVIYITPLYLILLSLSARQTGNRLAVIMGGIFAILLYPFMGHSALFIAGMLGGIVSFSIILYQEKSAEDKSANEGEG